MEAESINGMENWLTETDVTCGDAKKQGYHISKHIYTYVHPS